MNVQSGLFHYNKAQDKWTYSSESGNSVHELFYDQENQKRYLLDENGMLISETEDGVLTYTQACTSVDGDKYIITRGMLVSKSGEIWLSAEDALRHITKNGIKIYDKSNSAFHYAPLNLMEDSKGRIWAETHEGVAYWDGEAWIEFNRKNSPVRAVARNTNSNLKAIVEDNEGNIYIQSRDKVFKWDGLNWHGHQNWNKAVDDCDDAGLFIDKQNNLWIFNDGKGIYKCTEGNCEPILENIEIGYHTILEDAEARMWIFTKYDGLMIYNPKG